MWESNGRRPGGGKVPVRHVLGDGGAHKVIKKRLARAQMCVWLLLLTARCAARYAMRLKSHSGPGARQEDKQLAVLWCVCHVLCSVPHV